MFSCSCLVSRVLVELQGESTMHMAMQGLQFTPRRARSTSRIRSTEYSFGYVCALRRRVVYMACCVATPPTSELGVYF